MIRIQTACCCQIPFFSNCFKNLNDDCYIELPVRAGQIFASLQGKLSFPWTVRMYQMVNMCCFCLHIVWNSIRMNSDQRLFFFLKDHKPFFKILRFSCCVSVVSQSIDVLWTWTLIDVNKKCLYLQWNTQFIWESLEEDIKLDAVIPCYDWTVKQFWVQMSPTWFNQRTAAHLLWFNLNTLCIKDNHHSLVSVVKLVHNSLILTKVFQFNCVDRTSRTMQLRSCTKVHITQTNKEVNKLRFSILKDQQLPLSVRFWEGQGHRSLH